MTRLARLGCGSAAAAIDYGAPSQFPLSVFETNTTNTDTSGFGWIQDNTHTNAGYVGATVNSAYFSALVLATPKAAIWGVRYLMDVGPDFGKVDIALASVGYQLAARPSGDTAGKLQPDDGSYGPALNYVKLVTEDCYNAGAVVEGKSSNGSIDFIPGGADGAVLTGLAALGSDAFTGFHISNGGPGWYRLRFKTNGKNAASTGFKIRVSVIVWHRVSDDGWP